MANRVSKSKEIKVAVVGYGGSFNMGMAHLNEMKRAGMVPLAVCEIDPARREAARKDFADIETYATVGEMLKKSAADLVTLITPHNTHAKLALQCLKAGRHVVVEKPMAITTAECDAMIAAAKKHKVMLSTYHNRHWDGCVMSALQSIHSGAIGPVHRIEAHMGGYGKPGDWWRTSRSISGGILYDWGVHLLEYSLQILKGKKVVEVSGFSKTGYWGPKTAWEQDAIEDEAQAVVRFDDGTWLTLTLTSLDSNPKRGVLEITGEKGTYIMDHNNYEIILPGENATHVEKGKCVESQSWKFYQNVADHLIRGKELVITGEWARRPIHILDLAIQSAKSGKALKARYS